MRRPIALLCLAATLAVPAPVAAAPAFEPGVVADEEAMASWMFPTDRPRHFTWLFAGAYRNAVTGGKTVTTGYAVKGSCEVERERDQTVTTCHGRGIGGRLPEDAFQVDLALREARLVLTEKGATHHLAWDADATPPSGYVAGEDCEAGSGQGAGSIRHAHARGELFDRRLGGAGRDHALLSRGVMVTECTSKSLAEIARLAASGATVRVTFR